MDCLPTSPWCKGRKRGLWEYSQWQGLGSGNSESLTRTQVRGKLLDDQVHTYAEYSPAFALQVVQPVLLGNLSLVRSVKDDMLIARCPLAGST